MDIKKGNLLESDVPAIIHQCNCFHTMGGGIALQLATKYPAVYKADLTTAYGDKDKMGTFSVAEINGPKLKVVLNLYAQYDFGPGKQTEYMSLYIGLVRCMTYLKGRDIHRVGLPYIIGCGLAGGDEDTVMTILRKVQEEYPEVSIELYKLER